MTRTTILRRAAAAALAAALIPALAPGAPAEGRTLQVRFPKGRSSATFRGTLPAGTAEYDAYVLRARKGQTLSVALTTDDDRAYLVVYSMELGPTEDRITPEEPVREWSGPLPVTGGYSVQVYTEGGGGTAYALEAGVK